MLCVVDGLLFYDGDSDAASLNPALNAAMLMTRYAPIASSGDKTTSYLVGLLLYIDYYSWFCQNFAQNQMNYALGKNPMSGSCVDFFQLKLNTDLSKCRIS